MEKLKESARKEGSAALDQIKTAAQSAVRNAQETGQSFVTNQKENLASRFSEYANAVQSMSEKLRGEDDNILTGPAEKAAESLNRISDYLREKEPAELLDDLESLARRKPELVFGGLFVVGFAAARFFKASRRQSPAKFDGAEHLCGSARSKFGRRRSQPAITTPVSTSASRAVGRDSLTWKLNRISPCMTQPVNILDLVKSLRDDTTGLIRDEVALAKTEIGEKITTASRNVGYLAVGALVAYAGVIFSARGGEFHSEGNVSGRRRFRAGRKPPQLPDCGSYRRRGGCKPRDEGNQHVKEGNPYSNENRQSPRRR